MKKISSYNYEPHKLYENNDSYEEEENTRQGRLNRSFIKTGPVILSNGEEIEPERIVNCVNDALEIISSEYPSYYRIIYAMNIIYVKYSSSIPTMCVDAHMNMYINAGFVVENLELNKNLVAIVICHEFFHVLYDHIERGKAWLNFNNKTWNAENGDDINLASDIEVNSTLLAMRIGTKEELKNIRALYLEGMEENVVPFETLLEDETIMNELRKMTGRSNENNRNQDSDEVIKTTKEWDEGYKKAWNHIAKLIKKYGPEKIKEMLAKSRILDVSSGLINKDFKEDDLFKLNFIKIKNWEEFFHEALYESSVVDKGDYESYKGGMIEAIKNIMSSIENSMRPGGEFGGDSGQKKPKIETEINKSDLDEIELELPNKNNENDVDGEDDNLRNIKNKEKGNQGTKNTDNKGGNDQNKEKKDEQDDQGGNDQNKEKKGKQGKQGNKTNKNAKNEEGDNGNKSGQQNEGGKGNRKGMSNEIKYDNTNLDTGSIITNEENFNKDVNDILKDSGYDVDDINEINNMTYDNERKFTSKTVENIREDLAEQSGLPGGSVIRNILNGIKDVKSKYKEVWDVIMKDMYDFLETHTRRSSRQVVDRNNTKWFRNRTMLTIGASMPEFELKYQSPQDLNILVDTSGSMSMEIYKEIFSSLASYCDEADYAGINIATWSDSLGDINRVVSKDEGENTDVIVNEICHYVENAKSGGTSLKACAEGIVLLSCMYGENDNEKDHVYVILTDGEVSESELSSIENYIEKSINNYAHNNDIGDLPEDVPTRCFWMIYSVGPVNNNIRESWKKHIKHGTCIFFDTKKTEAEIISRKK